MYSKTAQHPGHVVVLSVVRRVRAKRLQLAKGARNGKRAGIHNGCSLISVIKRIDLVSEYDIVR